MFGNKNLIKKLSEKNICIISCVIKNIFNLNMKFKKKLFYNNNSPNVYLLKSDV